MVWIKRLLWLIFYAAICGQASANSITSLTVFGDSISDGGDLDTAVVSYYKLTGGSQTNPPYANHRFTNGPTAVEYLADNLGLNSTSTFFNYAVGGATTSDIYLGLSQLTTSNPSLMFDPSGLYVINGGGNDLSGSINSPEIAAQNLVDTVSLLNSRGANNFLIINLPTNPFDSNFTSFSAFNYLLGQKLNNLNINQIALFDMAMALTEGAQNGGLQTITNVADPCYSNGVVCANPDAYVFWDYVHFTTKIHAYLANEMTEALQPSAVPVPAALPLMASALGFFGFARRRMLR
jgi:phospholipase/lecithinase/hemolysin